MYQRPYNPPPNYRQDRSRSPPPPRLHHSDPRARGHGAPPGQHGRDWREEERRREDDRRDGWWRDDVNRERAGEARRSTQDHGRDGYRRSEDYRDRDMVRGSPWHERDRPYQHAPPPRRSYSPDLNRRPNTVVTHRQESRGPRPDAPSLPVIDTDTTTPPSSKWTLDPTDARTFPPPVRRSRRPTTDTRPPPYPLPFVAPFVKPYVAPAKQSHSRQNSLEKHDDGHPNLVLTVEDKARREAIVEEAGKMSLGVWAVFVAGEGPQVVGEVGNPLQGSGAGAKKLDYPPGGHSKFNNALMPKIPDYMLA
ncbi:hypothetical protein M427DRAFT_63496 [Gonapodya prolifera JEL478]|uniref:Uncharacterized protein n=1 Tax=Gonapodya prolifera (strain JEL478) TaxID=1344416 RepID=A0A138ZZ23_GONPJ|nr:hypothetical protein M427DRAFT_63496 [Gonapodya prolifera JEL478]|eukprot:KXS09757.1 hypothetical protein M427DRAFT_63496 [Gonapodya prolifera JEL478]